MKSKYKRKFAKQLIEGLREDGKSIDECCKLWGVSPDAYYDWKKVHPEFAEAAKIGDRDKNAWWHKTHREVSAGLKSGNASCLNFGMKNQAGWVDKQEIHTTHDEQVHTIQIEMLPTRNDLKFINDQQLKNLPNQKSD